MRDLTDIAFVLIMGWLVLFLWAWLTYGVVALSPWFLVAVPVPVALTLLLVDFWRRHR